MAEQLEVYKCDPCGNIVEVLHGGGGELVCCGESMELFVENTVDAAKEKHVPVIEKTADGFKVNVGSVAHPMEAEHYIEWIEVIVKRLKPFFASMLTRSQRGSTATCTDCGKLKDFILEQVRGR
jgi:desulfoferrodoxin